jgi:alpha-glucuronidase
VLVVTAIFPFLVQQIGSSLQWHDHQIAEKAEKAAHGRIPWRPDECTYTVTEAQKLLETNSVVIMATATILTSYSRISLFWQYDPLSGLNLVSRCKALKVIRSRG